MGPPPKPKPVENYGVWAGTPVSYKAEFAQDDSRSPHVILSYTDSVDTKLKSTAINVKSIGKETRLVYWVNKDFKHPIVPQLAKLNLAFHAIPGQANINQNLSLDFLRQNPRLFVLEDGRMLPHDIPGPDNDVLDQLIPLIERAIAAKTATVYIFGSQYSERTGIHDVHMNQGSDPKFNNGVGTDGALIIHFPASASEEEHFEAIFLAFASQRIPTDNNGWATADSKPLSDIAKKTLSLDPQVVGPMAVAATLAKAAAVAPTAAATTAVETVVGKQTAAVETKEVVDV